MLQLRMIICSQQISACFWCNLGQIFLECIISYFAVFGEITAHLRERIVNLKIISCGKSSFSCNKPRKSQIMPILGEITAYLHKRKNKHFKTNSRKKSRISDFRRNGHDIYAKNRTFKVNQPQKVNSFANFWQKNNVFTQNDRSYKKYQLQKKKSSEFDNYSRKSRI